jgi:hypothetical protein
MKIPTKGALARDYIGSILVTGFFLSYLLVTKEVSFKKIFFGALITADLYFMTHVDGGSKDDPWMVVAFFLTSLFLASSFLYNSLSIKSDFPQPHLNIFTKIGLGIFKVMAGTRARQFWLMSAIYFSGVMALIVPGVHKPPWVWWGGGGTTLMYIIYNLAVMRRIDRETEAEFVRPTIPMPILRPDPHPGGQVEARSRTVEIFVEGESRGTVQVTSNSAPIVELLPEPEPENRLARVLREDYPL